MSDTERKPAKQCVYPDWEGGFTKDEHVWGKDGFCGVCGEYDAERDTTKAKEADTA